MTLDGSRKILRGSMSTALPLQSVYATPEEYLRTEEVSETKHEYLAGVIYAMAGASWEHNVISGNLFVAVAIQLRGKKCQHFGSDMRLRIRKGEDTFFYYPDLTVDCSGRRSSEVDEPTVIVEVLSRQTERIDRNEKLGNYQSIPSMRAYVLVDQYQPTVTVFRRGEGGAWYSELLNGVGASLHLPEIGCSVPLAEIYDQVWPAN